MEESIFYSYTNNINGFAAVLDEDHAAKLSSKKPSIVISPLLCSIIRKHSIITISLVEIPGVVSVFPNKVHPLHTTHSWEFMGLESEGKTQPNSLWEKGNYGDDVIIGHFDTGGVTVTF